MCKHVYCSESVLGSIQSVYSSISFQMSQATWHNTLDIRHLCNCELCSVLRSYLTISRILQIKHIVLHLWNVRLLQEGGFSQTPFDHLQKLGIWLYSTASIANTDNSSHFRHIFWEVFPGMLSGTLMAFGF